MRIASVSIAGFRSIQSASFSVSSLQVLIGKNSCGKSNLLRALEFFFVPKYSMVDDDFHRSSGGDRVHEAWVEVTFQDLNPGDQQRFQKYLLPDGSIRVRRIATLDESGGRTAEYRGVALRPVPREYRREIYVGTPTEQFDALTATFGDVSRFRPPGRLTSDLVTQTLDRIITERHTSIAFAPELEASRFFGLDSTASSYLGKFILIPALTDLEAEANLLERGRLSHIIDLILGQIIERSPEFQRAVDGLRQAIQRFNRTDLSGNPNPTRPTELTALEGDLEHELVGWNVRVAIDVESPGSDGFAGVPRVNVDDGYMSRLQAKGHGLQRAFVLAALSVWRKGLEKAQVDGAPSTPRPALVLAIEEPELYLHPQQQRNTFDVLRRIGELGGAQIVVSSHSPHFIDAREPLSIIRCIKDSSGRSSTSQLTAPPFSGEAALSRKRRFQLSLWITSDKAELFFADRVVLVEGPTEMATFPFVAAQLGILDRGVTLVDCGGKGSMAVYVEFVRAFGITCRVIHDEDPITAAPGDEEYEKQERMFQLNSEIANACGTVLPIRVVPGSLDSVIGFSESQRKAKGKPFAALEHLQDFGISDQAKEIVRWVYA